MPNSNYTRCQVAGSPRPSRPDTNGHCFCTGDSHCCFCGISRISCRVTIPFTANPISWTPVESDQERAERELASSQRYYQTNLAQYNNSQNGLATAQLQYQGISYQGGSQWATSTQAPPGNIYYINPNGGLTPLGVVTDIGVEPALICDDDGTDELRD